MIAQKRLAIIGSGDLGQLIAHHAKSTKLFEVIGFFDDFKMPGEIVKNIKVIGKTSDLIREFKKNSFDELLIGVGYKHFDFRKKLFETYNTQIPFANLVHPSSYVDPSCILGAGNVILPGCTLDMNVELKNNILLNTGCTIAHDTHIGDHCFLGPGVNLAGFIRIDECCFLGINTTIIDNIHLVSDVRTGGGTVIIKDITEPGTYIGLPAKKVAKE